MAIIKFDQASTDITSMSKINQIIGNYDVRPLDMGTIEVDAAISADEYDRLMKIPCVISVE